MAKRNDWSLEELLVVLDLYHRKGQCPDDPEVDELATLTGRTRASIIMRLGNFVAVDPTDPNKGLDGIGRDARNVFSTYPARSELFNILVKQARMHLGGMEQSRDSPSEKSESIQALFRRSVANLISRKAPNATPEPGLSEQSLAYTIDGTIRERLVAIALEWEAAFGVAPSITSAISEYDAAFLVGHSNESFGRANVSRTSVTRGTDFVFSGLRYQVKANRPSGKSGSFVTLVSPAKNYDWDRLIWILYDRHYEMQEAWEWLVDDYKDKFEGQKRISPADMRTGKQLKATPRESM